MHFEESCNITNMTSNSNDYNEENDNLYFTYLIYRNSSEKDFFDKGNISSRNKIDRNSERVKARENVIDEIHPMEKNHHKKSIVINYPQSSNTSNNQNTNKYLFNREQPINTNRSKNVNSMINMNMNNYTKTKPKGGKFPLNFL